MRERSPFQRCACNVVEHRCENVALQAQVLLLFGALRKIVRLYERGDGPGGGPLARDLMAKAARAALREMDK